MSRNSTAQTSDAPPSEEAKFEVSVMAASRTMSDDEMARAMQLTPEELRAKFEFELTVGAQQRKKAIVLGIYRRAATDPAAFKAFMSYAGKVVGESKRSQQRQATNEKRAATPKEKPLGKKAQAKVDARNAQDGTGWEGILGKNKNGAKPGERPH